MQTRDTHYSLHHYTLHVTPLLDAEELRLVERQAEEEQRRLGLQRRPCPAARPRCFLKCERSLREMPSTPDSVTAGLLSAVYRTPPAAYESFEPNFTALKACEVRCISIAPRIFRPTCRARRARTRLSDRLRKGLLVDHFLLRAR